MKENKSIDEWWNRKNQHNYGADSSSAPIWSYRKPTNFTDEEIEELRKSNIQKLFNQVTIFINTERKKINK